ncbi:Rne/Rng family ribonuclease [Actinomyces sp. zg-332]|nr:Rne/Rng family ribonuclease [Actinomyces sp. zg-332]
MIKITYDFDVDTPQYHEYIERLKKFHCNLNPDLPFSSLENLKDNPISLHDNVNLDIVFEAVDLSQIQPIEHPQRDLEEGKAENKDEKSISRRVERLRTRRKSSVLEIEEGDGTRRRRLRQRRRDDDEAKGVVALQGSTRLEAKRRRRHDNNLTTLRQTKITESEFLARRECVDRKMVVREKDGLNQIAVLEDGLLVEHYVARHSQTTSVGNVYLGRVQNVLPSMEAAFVDIGKERNAVLYAGEVNWDELGLEGNVRRIENALKPGDIILVQVTKDPIGHKGARLTSQVTLAGRHIVLVPSGAMTGISKKLPEEERRRLKKILRSIVPDEYGVIVRTAAEGASTEQIEDDVKRLVKIWEGIEHKQKTNNSPMVVHTEPELALRVIRDIFNEDFKELVVSGNNAWDNISKYVNELSPDLADRLVKWTDTNDVFIANRVDEQLAKGMDRKVWLPSGGYLIIDRTEAMTVIDVNTGKYIGAGGTLEETITKNNLESAEEIVRQLRLRDIGGIIVIDFVDMVLESNRTLVLRRLIECLGRDRTRHQVTEVTSLGLVQMTRKRVGQGLVEAFSSKCECCDGRGFLVHSQPVDESAISKKERKSRKNNSDIDNEKTLEVSEEDKDASNEYGVDASNKDVKSIGEKEKRNESSDYNVSNSQKGRRVSKNHKGESQNKHKGSSVALVERSHESEFSEKGDEDQVYGAHSEKPKRKKRKRVVSQGTFAPSDDSNSSIIIL